MAFGKVDLRLAKFRSQHCVGSAKQKCRHVRYRRWVVPALVACIASSILDVSPAFSKDPARSTSSMISPRTPKLPFSNSRFGSRLTWIAVTSVGVIGAAATIIASSSRKCARARISAESRASRQSVMVHTLEPTQERPMTEGVGGATADFDKDETSAFQKQVVEKRTEECPGCRSMVTNMRKHMKRCCPEFLPENAKVVKHEEREITRKKACEDKYWISDTEVQIAAERSVEQIADPWFRRVLNLRFGLDRKVEGETCTFARRRTPVEIGEILGGKYKTNPEAVLNVIRNALRSIPLVADDPKDLHILYEDEDLLAVSKPAFLRSTPVHRFVGKSLANQLVGHVWSIKSTGSPDASLVDPGAGTNGDVLLENAQRQRPPAQSEIPVPVHRLDQTTSGVVLCAKSKETASFLSDRWHTSECAKEYVAVVTAKPGARLKSVGDVSVVREPIGRDVNSTDPVRRAVNHDDGQNAATRLEVLSTRSSSELGVEVLLLSCKLEEQGRTHQIRVHAAHSGLPLVGDGMYGGLVASDSHSALDICIPSRVALHAWRLQVPHPRTSKPLFVEAPLPDDLCRCLDFFGLARPKSASERPSAKP